MLYLFLVVALAAKQKINNNLTKRIHLLLGIVRRSALSYQMLSPHYTIIIKVMLDTRADRASRRALGLRATHSIGDDGGMWLFYICFGCFILYVLYAVYL